MNIKLIKAIGIGATILGAAMSVVASWASDKQTDAAIDEKVTIKLNEIFSAQQISESTTEVAETIVD